MRLIRIQRKKNPGWRMPPNTIYVGKPTKWGNRYGITSRDRAPRQEAVDAFRRDLAAYNRFFSGTRWEDAYYRLIARELAGKNLACWCPLNQPCHADVLLEIANTVSPDGPFPGNFVLDEALNIEISIAATRDISAHAHARRC